MLFSCEQEREHWDHEMGCQSELQNAFTMSQREREPDDTGKINNWKKKGKFCLVETHQLYCPRTDASMGEHQRLVSVHPTRALAEAALAKYWAKFGDDHDPEGGAYIA